jgi:hypothetical protein
MRDVYIAGMVVVTVPMVVSMPVSMSLSVGVRHEVKDEQHATSAKTRDETLGCLFRMIKVVKTEADTCHVEVEELRCCEAAVLFA